MDFPTYLKSVGLNLNVVPGWESRQSGSRGFAPVGVMWHHTAGRNSLQYLIDRALVQFHISKSGVVSLISNGRTGHTGIGSSVVLNETRNGVAPLGDAGPRRLKDDAYGYKFYYGIEVENLGNGIDPYPKVQIEALVLLTAALCVVKDWPAEVVIHHREWTKRKIDMSMRSFFGMSTLEVVRYGIAQVKNVPYVAPQRPSYPSIEDLAGLSYRFGRVLGKGDKSGVNGDVWLFQEFLVEMGQTIKADGDFGPASHNATRAVQRLLDVTDDGLWGEVSALATDRFFALVHAEEKRLIAERKAEAKAKADVEAEKAAQAVIDAEAAAKAEAGRIAREKVEALAKAKRESLRAEELRLKAEALARDVDEAARREAAAKSLDNVKKEVEALPPEVLENPPEANEGERLSTVEVGVLKALVRAILAFVANLSLGGKP